jgi:disease resistance protein RPM1
MAEALVFVVLQKIAATIGEEVVKAGTPKLFNKIPILREITYNIKQIEREFVVMQAFLRRMDVQASSNQTFGLWSEQVRKVAHEVEDVIDEYAYLVGKTKHANNIAIRALHYVKNAPAWNEIATQLKEVKGHIDHLTQMRDRYDITIPPEGSSNRHNVNRLLNISDYLNSVDETGIVGNLEERNQLIEWFTETNQDWAIISIWGMGGSGKTTLISYLYKTEDVKRHFNCFAFVSVSQSFQVEELLRRIIRQIFEKDDKITTEFDLMNYTSLLETLHSELLNKRYLVVLDDVWKRDAWVLLSRAFPKNNKGSRVVITTRNEVVAHLANDNHSLKMRDLSEEEAWELFNKKAFAKQQKNICPEIMSWAMKIVDKCQGLPLAIVAIGSLLSFGRLEEKEWKTFYNQLSCELSSNSELSWVASVLNLSYDDLPTYLKNCFLYCSLLPEDYLIRRNWITMMLISEGFIDDRGPGMTMEEVAESYLMELANRSLLEVVERTIYGRAKKFKMHDLVRDMHC